MTAREQYRRRRALAHFWAGLGALAVLALLLPPLVAALLPTISPWHDSTVVASGSMEPAVRTGDVVVTRSVPEGTRVQPSSVLLHRPEGSEHLRLHRVSEVDAAGRYLTRGDANRTDDGTPVPPDRVIGVGALVVPALGTPLLWVDEGRWGTLLLLVVVAVGLVRGARLGWRGDVPATEDGAEGTGEARAPRPRAGRSRIAVPVLAAVVVVALALDPTGIVGRSAAAFTDQASTGQNLVRAGHWGGPLTLSLADPGPRLTGAVPFTVETTGSRSSTTVTMQLRPHGGGAWTTLCTAASGPSFTCTADTTAHTVGAYDLRAVATATDGTTVTSQEHTTTLHLPTFAGVGGPATPNGSSRRTAPYPAGTRPGDAILLIQANTISDLTPTPPGWTLLSNVQTEGTQGRLTIWWRRAGNETSVGVDTGSEHPGIHLWTVRYEIPDGRAPQVTTAHQAVQSGPWLATPTLTPAPQLVTTDAATVLHLAAVRSDSTLSLATPAGFELRAVAGTATRPHATRVAIGDRVVFGAGPVASPTWLQVGNVDVWGWTAIAVR